MLTNICLSESLLALQQLSVMAQMFHSHSGPLPYEMETTLELENN